LLSTDAWHQIDPSDAIRETAIPFLRVHPLRAADALQLAAAFVAGEPRPHHSKWSRSMTVSPTQPQGVSKLDQLLRNSTSLRRRVGATPSPRSGSAVSDRAGKALPAHGSWWAAAVLET